MFNMGLGYALPFFDNNGRGAAGFTMRPEFGFAVSANRNAYIVLSPQIQLIDSFYSIAFSVGFQYDFPILVRGLFLYLRGNLGYELGILTSGTDIALAHYGLIMPEVGIKYVVNGKVNFGFEPVSLPITFNANGAQAAYRQMFYAGVNF